MAQKDALICLVDCNPTMMVEVAPGEMPFRTALTCIVEVVKKKIIQSPADMLAVVLYGTHERRGEFEGIYVVQDVDLPSVELIQALEQLKVRGEFFNVCLGFPD